MGHGFKGDTGHYHSFSENIPDLSKNYPYSSETGYFGVKGHTINGKPGKSPKVREIASSDPIETAKGFYDLAAYGGKEEALINGEGYKTEMRDGTVLTFREVSHSNGSPAVDINISSTSEGQIKTQKIHFIKE